MHPIQGDVEELRRQLRKGSVQKAYRAIISFMTGLRTHFVTKYGNSAVSSLYQGYMDMTYFALLPPSLKHRDLKVAIVFNYDAFRFEAWLAARNRKVQRQYWELAKDSHWAEYRVVTPAPGVDAVIEYDLAKDFDLDDPDALTAQIEKATAAFTKNMERFFSQHQPNAG